MGNVERVVGVERRSCDSIWGVKYGCSELTPVGSAEPDPSVLLLENHGDIV